MTAMRWGWHHLFGHPEGQVTRTVGAGSCRCGASWGETVRVAWGRIAMEGYERRWREEMEGYERETAAMDEDYYYAVLGPMLR